MDLKLLAAKLPDVRNWIDRTLAAHRVQARSVASYRFPRLAKFYSPVFLEMSFVVEVPRVPMPPLTSMGLPELAEFEKGNYAGITYRNTYFVREGLGIEESLHFHELVHVVQWAHLGVDGFLTAYALGLLQQGYRNSPLEVMAYDLQARFDANEAPFDVKSLVRSQLGKPTA